MHQIFLYKQLGLAFACVLLISSLIIPAYAGVVMKPTYSSDIDYTALMLNGDYDPNVTHPDDILGFEVGHRVASAAQISESINTWKTQSARLKVLEYAKSHEGRPLYAVFISTPENIAR